MINDLGRVPLAPGSREPDQQAVPALTGFDPSRVEAEFDHDLINFACESNRIEGIETTTEFHVMAHWKFLRGPITIPALVQLVSTLQPDARFRNEVGVPGVRVGNHIAPPSGPKIEADLRRILAMRNPWEQHVAYETLHPFTDGNGRSGRAIWLHRHFHETALDPWAVRRGFLHSFYYQTLSGVRLASAMSARSGETAGLAPQDASAVAQPDAHTGPSS